MYSTPMYTNIGANTGYKLEYASTILACLGLLVVIPVYVFYWKGPKVRKASKFAQELAADRKANEGRRASRLGSLAMAEDSTGYPSEPKGRQEL